MLVTNVIKLRQYATDIYYNKSYLNKGQLVNLHKFLIKVVNIVCYRKKLTRSFKHWSKLLLKETFEEFLITKKSVDSELNFINLKCFINKIQNKLVSTYTHFFEKLARNTLVITNTNNNILKRDEIYNDKLKKILNLLSNFYLRKIKYKNMCFVNTSIKRYVFQIWESKLNMIRKHLINKNKIINSSNCYQLVI